MINIMVNKRQRPKSQGATSGVGSKCSNIFTAPDYLSTMYHPVSEPTFIR